jgi:hypothetical protein
VICLARLAADQKVEMNGGDYDLIVAPGSSLPKDGVIQPRLVWEVFAAEPLYPHLSKLAQTLA